MMTHKYASKGFSAGLAIGSSLAVLSMLIALTIIFFPPLAAAISASLYAISALKAVLGFNAFLMVLGVMVLQDTTMRRQAQLDPDKSYYPLALGLIGFCLAHVFAAFGKLMGKGLDKLFGNKVVKNNHTGNTTAAITKRVRLRPGRSLSCPEFYKAASSQRKLGSIANNKKTHRADMTNPKPSFR